MDNYRIAERYTKAIAEQDFEAFNELAHDEIEVRYPQSGEVFHGKDNYLALLANYPGGLGTAQIAELHGHREKVQVVGAMPFAMPQITVSGSGDTFIGEGVATYGDGSVYFIAWVFRIKDGKIRQETWYFGAPFEAPEWRDPYRS